MDPFSSKSKINELEEPYLDTGIYSSDSNVEHEVWLVLLTREGLNISSAERVPFLSGKISWVLEESPCISW